MILHANRQGVPLRTNGGSFNGAGSEAYAAVVVAKSDRVGRSKRGSGACFLPLMLTLMIAHELVQAHGMWNTRLRNARQVSITLTRDAVGKTSGGSVFRVYAFPVTCVDI